MGIIEKQSIKGTVFTYAGVVIGFVNTGLIFPKILLTEQIGLLNILISYSLVLSQLSSLGFNSATTRLFTFFRNDKNNHNGFFFLIVMVPLVGFIITLSIFTIVKPLILSNSAESSSLFSENYVLIIPLTFFTLYFNSFDNYFKVLYNAVIGTFLKEFLIRLFVLVSIVLFYLELIDFNQFIMLYGISYCLPMIILLVFLIYEKHFNLIPQFRFIDKELKKSLISVSLYAIISGFAGIAIANIDKIMINQIMGLSDTGVYSIAFYFGTLIIIPARSLVKISAPIIADSWKNNDLNTISNIYDKSCLNQSIIGALIFIGLLINIDNIFEFLPLEFGKGRYVIIFIALSFLTDMVTGTAVNIISISKYYKFQTFFMFAFIFLIILTNLYFIPRYGIVGAAFASFISKLAINLIRVIFIFLKFKLIPYTYKYWIIGIIAIISYYLTKIFGNIDLLLVDIFLKSSIVTIIFILLTYVLKISDDFNRLINNVFRKIIKYEK